MIFDRPNISIIIPVYNEENYIAACLDSMLESDYSNDKMEIFVVDGGSEDRTIEIIQEYQTRHPFLKLLHNAKKIVPVAMNIAIKEATGEYIIRLDAHASYPKDYFSKLIEYHKKLDAQNVGAVIRTEVKNKTKKSLSIKEVLSHKLGVGNSNFRTGIESVQEVDTVPFGCYKKEVFEKYGFYDERLIRNQDIELNKRIINAGGKIYLIPEVECTYFARENFKDLAKNNFANGKWNILTAYYTKTLNSLSVRHFVPLLFVLSLIISALLALCSPYFGIFGLVSMVSYLTLVIIISLKLRDNSNSFVYLVLSFLTLHLSYGVGSLVGIFKVIKIIFQRGKYE
ncbi:Glycosyltransferase [hydrothermal vent metagenome]|uniref:Glycosyltransferase n=1 Tax=hydrothermal vent metagenome TaxID=652676 RepID=A0A1W1CJS5_9ZZZZ